jgi:hypothetical protein
VRHEVLLALALASAPIGAPTLAWGADPADARYQALVTAAKAAGDRPVDWQALRFAYADRPAFDLQGAADEPIHAGRMRQAFRQGDFTTAIDEAKLVIDADFVDAEAHLIASQAYGRTRDANAAARERAIAVGLLTSIKTGDGQSAAQALTVINTKEEYVLMATDGRRIVRQSAQRLDGHSYDVVETVNRAGAPATFYFLTDRVVAAQAHVLRIP